MTKLNKNNSHIDYSIHFLKKCDDNVLVYCSTRSVGSISIVISYLMKEK